MNAENNPKTDSEHLATKYGTVFCPVEKVQAEVDKDNECSACGSSNVVFDLSTELDAMQNTQAEKEAVDKGVQQALPQDARWHRREARRLLVGKPGLTNEQKVKRMQRAKEHLETAIALEIQSW
jgi:hypothetical protein